MAFSVPLKSLKDEDYYFVQLEDGVWRLPIATGKEIKKYWKNRDLKQFDGSDRKPTGGFTLVECDQDRFISVKPFGSKYISLAHEIKKLTETKDTILTEA